MIQPSVRLEKRNREEAVQDACECLQHWQGHCRLRIMLALLRLHRPQQKRFRLRFALE